MPCPSSIRRVSESLSGVPRWSGSVDPSTPTARTVGVLPTEPGEMIPSAAVRVLSTAAQTLVYHYGLRLVHHPGARLHHTCRCHRAAADPGSPSLAPRSAGNDFREANARSAAQPGNRSSACELACSESLPHFLSTTQTGKAQLILALDGTKVQPFHPRLEGRAFHSQSVGCTRCATYHSARLF